jgi:hypothetical protein
MKINTQKHDVSAAGMMNQRKFTVDAGAHIMAVLSGLYKNPVDAMVREYLTNMYDAYVALKRVRPDAEIVTPVLHVPTALDGNLTFTDFGVGMSLETVWNVYATYGASTKNGSNDEVGGFGLGSKTAFCYNGGASWTIESRYDGQKHIFMAFIGEDGVPNLSHVTSVMCPGPTGLTISIPIRREDHRECISAVQRYAPYFPMALTVQGCTVPARNYAMKTDTWAVFFGYTPVAAYGRSHNGMSNVIMGNVPYPINLGSVIRPRLAGVDDWTLRDFLQYNNFDFFVNIGDVDIVPSRDDLKYTDRTKACLEAAVKNMLQQIGAEVGKLLSACDTEWQAIRTYRTMQNLHNLQSVVQKLTWRGNVISSTGITRTLESLQKLDPSVVVTQYRIGDSSRATPEITVSPNNLTVTPDNNTFIVLDDMPKGGAMMARALVYKNLVHKTSSGRSARYGHTVGHVLLIQTKLSQTALSAFFGGVPEADFLSASALKGTVTVPKALKGVKDTIYRWSGSSWDARVNIPTGKTFYYLPLTKDAHMRRYSFVSNRYGSQKDAVALVRSAAGSLGINIGDVLYGVKTDDVKNFDSSWVNLVTAMEAKMSDSIKQNAETFALSRVSTPHAYRTVVELIKTTNLDNAIPVFQKFVQDHTRIMKAHNDAAVNVYNQIAGRIPSLVQEVDTVIQNITVPDMNAQYEEVLVKYPMIGLLIQMTNMTHYGNNRVELLKKNSAQVLAYARSIR